MNYLKIPGWFDFEEVYERAVQRTAASGCLVEVGSWMGKSAWYMCDLIRRSRKKLYFFCVDTWQGSEEHQDIIPKLKVPLRASFDYYMSEHTGRYAAIEKPSIEAAKLFEDGSLDFVFIDASHNLQDVTDDITAWLPKLKSKGLLAGHDILWPSVKKAVDVALGRYSVFGNSWAFVK